MKFIHCYFTAALLIAISQTCIVVAAEEEKTMITSRRLLRGNTSAAAQQQQQQQQRSLLNVWGLITDAFGYEFTSAMYNKILIEDDGSTSVDSGSIRCYHFNHRESVTKTPPSTLGNTNGSYYWEKIPGTTETTQQEGCGGRKYKNGNECEWFGNTDGWIGFTCE